MAGIDLDGDPTDVENGMGIIPAAVVTMFARAREFRNERAGVWKPSSKFTTKTFSTRLPVS
jgi:kinesin family protein 4/21/27